VIYEVIFIAQIRDTMTFEEFKSTLLRKPENFAQKMYDYGYYCSLRYFVNFDEIRLAFYNYNYSEEETKAYIQTISRGYRSGYKRN